MTTNAAPPPDGAGTDPRKLGWMTGFPPSPDKAITYADGSFRQYPRLRWSWSNIRQLVPTRAVWRGKGPASPLPEAWLSTIHNGASGGRAFGMASPGQLAPGWDSASMKWDSTRGSTISVKATP